MAAPVLAGVAGIKALQHDIDKLEKEQQGPLWNAMKRAGYAAVKPIVPATRSILPIVTGRLGNTVRASGTRSGASVRMGTAAVPYAGWVEFGGTRPDGSERDYIPSGRYLFPAAQGLAGAAAREYSQELTVVFASAGVWTNSTDTASAVHD